MHTSATIERSRRRGGGVPSPHPVWWGVSRVGRLRAGPPRSAGGGHGGGGGGGGGGGSGGGGRMGIRQGKRKYTRVPAAAAAPTAAATAGAAALERPRRVAVDAKKKQKTDTNNSGTVNHCHAVPDVRRRGTPHGVHASGRPAGRLHVYWWSCQQRGRQRPAARTHGENRHPPPRRARPADPPP